ncbi:polysialyltransferase family glycosyltransferase [Planomicrobium sp. CPCC 101110]|uniref:polysialyltransferase family glycosyltransferase n=1 Tax=Planomicrobium sp. CPCC 101110 TaxID=2599619 RepID=UPI0011B6735A|nr:polysialyltransferase family glycosyltransferase [Planomicrobium sp. CPCC 101110]TWT27719.1 exopolysaccharide biosynthesis protein [Planomicrobium sp. CPCC 101110]
MNLFVCSTPYHIFVSICLLNSKNEKGIFYLTTHDSLSEKNFNKYKEKLLELENVVEVYIRKRDKIKEWMLIEGIIDKFEYIKLKKVIKTSTVYIFPWNPYSLYTITNFIYTKSKQLHLVEDGSNLHQYKKPRIIKIMVKKFVYGVKTNFYKDKKLKSILVQYPSKYPDFLKPKLTLLDLNNLMNKLDQELKNKILNVFLSTRSTNAIASLKNKKNSIIVLSQPLSEDGYLSEKVKIGLYQEIIDRYKNEYSMIIKKHPREKTNYNLENVIELDGEFPSEIFALLNLKFNKAIGICTSAIDTIEADERINTNSEFFKRGNINE